MRRKIILILVCFALITTTVCQSFAETDSVHDTLGPINESEENVLIFGESISLDENGVVILSDAQRAEILKVGVAERLIKSSPTNSSIKRIGGKKAAFKIAQWILKNRKKLTNVVGKVLGPKKAVKFGEALKYMEGPLRKIEKANNKGMSIIKKIIYNGLRSANMKHKTADELATAICAIIDVLM